MRIRLGHIVYSNCFPVHARLLDRPAPGDPELIEGIPSRLNQRLATGTIDVAPCSSIEFARHAAEYRVLPDLVIGARGPVRSILLLSRRPVEELGRARIAMPTASATSVVLLRVLLRMRWNVEFAEFPFDQAGQDPFAAGADAALFIGDVALRDELYPDLPFRYDLGTEWHAFTGLPFAFAVWQARDIAGAPLRRLHQVLLDSREYGLERSTELAERHAGRFGFPPEKLDAYWRDLRYVLDDPMKEGLLEFYRLAAEIREIPAVPTLRYL